MAYNKAKEERKWRLWKEAEEKKLRSLGVSEDATLIVNVVGGMLPLKDVQM